MKIISVLLVIKIHSRIGLYFETSFTFETTTLSVHSGIKKGLLLLGDYLQLGVSRMVFVKIIWTVFQLNSCLVQLELNIKLKH